MPGYRQGLFCRLLLLRERVVRGAVAGLVLGRFWLLFTVAALQSRADDPRLRRPRGEGTERKGRQGNGAGLAVEAGLRDTHTHTPGTLRPS